MCSLPSVTVLVPTFNRASLIRETLDSLVSQAYAGDLEILVIDDGSTDDTPSVLREYDGRGRVRVVRQANAGVAAARNLGLKEARGEYIALCDSDDLWTPNRLEPQVELMRQHPKAGLVYGDYECFEEGPGGGRRTWRLSDLRPSGYVFPHLIRRMFIVPATTLFPRRLALEVGGFDPATTRTEDYDLCLRLCARHEALYDARICCLYRKHGESLTRQQQLYWKAFLVTLGKARVQVRRFQETGDLTDPVDGVAIGPETLREWELLLTRRMGSFHERLLNLALKEGDLEAAQREWRALKALTPGTSRVWTLGWKLLRLRLGLKPCPSN